MANSFPRFPQPSLFFFFILAITFSFSNLTAQPQPFSPTLSSQMLRILNKKEKLSHLHFYFHDIISGTNQTSVRVAQAAMTDTSLTAFGAVNMMDDPLTETPELGSKVVGRAQGMYGSASQTELGLVMVMSFVFTEGKYNGSSVSVLGRNTVESGMREMPIVGGTGLFRFCRGYAQARTHSFDTFQAIVEYDIYVFHY